MTPFTAAALFAGVPIGAFSLAKAKISKESGSIEIGAMVQITEENSNYFGKEGKVMDANAEQVFVQFDDVDAVLSFQLDEIELSNKPE
jgi:hypothetical protein